VPRAGHNTVLPLRLRGEHPLSDEAAAQVGPGSLRVRAVRGPSPAWSAYRHRPHPDKKGGPAGIDGPALVPGQLLLAAIQLLKAGTST
jgi:hypothetical protein